MTIPFLIVSTVVAAVGTWLAVVLVRFNRRRRRVIESANKLDHSSLERIYTAIEAIGSEEPNGYILARTNRTTADARLLVPLTGIVAPSPWVGQEVEIHLAKDVRFSLGGAQVNEPQLLGKIFRPVAVPRRLTKSGAKARNTFEPGRYLAGSVDLRTQLEAACPEDPQGLLAYLLCAGRQSHEFDPIDQARIGTSPSWVQDAEQHLCPVCKQRMALILQVPGTMLSRKAYHRGTFFFFGCPSHPTQTSSLGQFT